MDEKEVKELINSQKNFENSTKMVELLTLINNDIKSIKGWVTYFGILSLLSIFVSMVIFFSALGNL